MGPFTSYSAFNAFLLLYLLPELRLCGTLSFPSFASGAQKIGDFLELRCNRNSTMSFSLRSRGLIYNVQFFLPIFASLKKTNFSRLQSYKITILFLFSVFSLFFGGYGVLSEFFRLVLAFQGYGIWDEVSVNLFFEILILDYPDLNKYAFTGTPWHR